MGPEEMNLPDLLVHADWSVRAGKRCMAQAVRMESDGRRERYVAEAPQPAGAPSTLLYRLRDWAGLEGVVLAGFDFPIGLPYRYARDVGVDDFAALLPRLGWGEWEDFYRVAERPEEIGLDRPFYPQRPGGTKHQHLVKGLEVTAFGDLRRVCEWERRGLRAAAPLFWTLGPQQVGKAAISGWRDMLAPALRDPTLDVALWPFDGPLSRLLRPGRIVVAETYPAAYYERLGLATPARKRQQDYRSAAWGALQAWMRRQEIVATAALVEIGKAGFGEEVGGEDGFDAVVGLLGMLDVVMGGRPAGTPPDERVRRVEGWILGRPWEQAPGEPEDAPDA